MSRKARVKPGKLQGEISIPSSKSHTLRSLLFALMAKGKSRIHHPLPSADTVAMLDAIRLFGARVDMEGDALIVEGVAGKLQPAEDVIQCGNSGQILRFLGALAGLSPSYSVFTGDFSIRHNRPVLPLLKALTELGAFAVSTRGDEEAPIIVRGPIEGGKATLNGEDSQPVSGLLMLGAFKPLELKVINPGEKPWIQLTLSWLDRFNVVYENHNFEHYRVKGGARIPAFEYRVPGDFSSAAFPIAAALTTRSEISLDNLDFGDVQGDKALISALEAMGARFDKRDSQLQIRSSVMQGGKVDINPFIDALPIVAVLACFASGPTEIVNGAIARRKESDRIHAIATELKKMGADIEERADGLLIRPSSLKGSLDLHSHHDHRLAMALTIAALSAEGESLIHSIDCVGKSYPTFFSDFTQLKARIEIE